MYQIINILLLFLLSGFCAFSYNQKYDNTLKNRITCFLIGVCFFSIGTIVLYLAQGVEVLINNLLLMNYHASQDFVFIGSKFIFTGYGFILMSIALQIKKIIKD